jgi:hypothetical protein
MKLGSKTDPQIPLSERANQLARGGEVTDIGLQLVREGYSAREVHNHLEETAFRDNLPSDRSERVIVWIAAFFLVEVAIGLWWWLS